MEIEDTFQDVVCPASSLRSKPVEDKIMEIASFEKFLVDKIKVDGKVRPALRSAPPRLVNGRTSACSKCPNSFRSICLTASPYLHAGRCPGRQHQGCPRQDQAHGHRRYRHVQALPQVPHQEVPEEAQRPRLVGHWVMLPRRPMMGPHGLCCCAKSTVSST